MPVEISLQYIKLLERVVRQAAGTCRGGKYQPGAHASSGKQSHAPILRAAAKLGHASAPSRASSPG